MNVEIKHRPLSGEWPEDGRDDYLSCRFKATHAQTMRQLRDELWRIYVHRAVIETDVREHDIRMDGMPRANARAPESPRVRLCFTHPEAGDLVYPCDTYEDWRDNLRAIVKTLEAQRAMDRYGATRKQEQYRGWKALPDSSTVAVLTKEQAWRWMCEQGDIDRPDYPPLNEIELREVYRRAAKRLHPDTGGSAEMFQQLTEAMRVLSPKPR